MSENSVMTPIGDRVIIRRNEAESETPGGIVLPEGSQERPTRGKVVSVGPGVLLENGTRAEMEVNEGDEVIFSMYAGQEVEIGEESLFILRQSEIYCVCN